MNSDDYIITHHYLFFQDENISVSARSSPDSSTDPWSCPQCGMGNESESRLLEHLLHVHDIRVVPPQSPTKTRCPVCRQHVADLSQHFALEHGDQNQQSIYQETTHQQQGLPSGASVTRIIPIVLPSQPGKFNYLARGQCWAKISQKKIRRKKNCTQRV